MLSNFIPFPYICKCIFLGEGPRASIQFSKEQPKSKLKNQVLQEGHAFKGVEWGGVGRRSLTPKQDPISKVVPHLDL